jgi:putative addiction module component (TIGR02574 family)
MLKPSTFPARNNMPPLLQQFGLDTLGIADRFALAQALWDSVNESLDAEPVAAEVRVELERRAALADSDPARGVSWKEIREAARARWSK